MSTEPLSVATSPQETACRLCGGEIQPKFRGIIAEETGDEFTIDECSRCGLGRTRPIPPDLAAYYDSTYYGHRHGLTSRLCRWRRLGLLRRWAGDGAGKTLLDYGCAEGDFLLAARSRGWHGVGIERHRPANAAGNVPIVASLDDLDERDRFDCVTFWHVLEHLADPVATLEQVRRHLDPGGLVLAAVPNFASWQARATGGSWLHLDLPRHLVHFTPKSITRTFEAAGFAVAAVAFGEFEYDLIGWSQSLLNRACGGRNEFFKAASGRPRRGSSGRAAFQFGAGVGLSILAVVPTLVETAMGRGGTLVVAARPVRDWQ